MKPVTHSRTTRGGRLRDIVVVRSGGFFYRGPLAGLNDAFKNHYQVEPHRLVVEITRDSFHYDGDARHTSHALRFWREYQDQCEQQHQHAVGRRLLRFVKETVKLFRELF